MFPGYPWLIQQVILCVPSPQFILKLSTPQSMKESAQDVVILLTPSAQGMDKHHLKHSIQKKKDLAV